MKPPSPERLARMDAYADALLESADLQLANQLSDKIASSLDDAPATEALLALVAALVGGIVSMVKREEQYRTLIVLSMIATRQMKQMQTRADAKGYGKPH